MPTDWPSPDSLTDVDTIIGKSNFAETSAADTTSIKHPDTITPVKDTHKMVTVQLNNGPEAKSLTPKHVRIQSPPGTSSPGSLTDDDVDSNRNSPSPNPTPSDRSPAQNQQKEKDGASSSSTVPKNGSGPASAPSSSPNTSTAISQVPASSLKRKRRTPDQKKAEEEEKERRRKEKEQKKKEADEKKAKEEAEKQARAQERSEKKAKLEAEKSARAQEREAKRRKKEEEARKAKEEKEKKERSQMKLSSFIVIPSAASLKKKSADADGLERGRAATAASASAVKYEDDMESPRSAKKPATESAYEKLFRPFFVQNHVRMARDPPLGCAAREARSRMLDQYISAQPQSFTVGRFAAESFGLVKYRAPRGKLHKPVRRTIETMHEMSRKAEATGSLEDQEAIRRQMREELAKVPVKYLCYREDVRPAYRGTVTQVPATVGKKTMRKLARRPNARVMPVDYDYDSEAEWVDEEGEDLDMADDEEEDLDDGEGVGDLIDDSEAVDLARFAANGLEPESTGLCWEDSQFVGPEAKLRDYQIEFIFGDHLERNQSIDPWSTAYWPDARSKTVERTTTTNGSSATKTEKKAKGDTATTGIPAGIAHADVAKIKKAIKAHVEAAPRISKVGLIEYLKSSAVDGIKVKGRDISAKDLKEVVETLAERKGKSKDVVWTLRPGYD